MLSLQCFLDIVRISVRCHLYQVVLLHHRSEVLGPLILTILIDLINIKGKLFVLVIMFAVGMFFRSGGLSSLVALAIGQAQTDMKGMIAEDVSADSVEKLDESLRAVRKRLTDGELDQSKVLPLLQEIQKVSKDRKVSGEEVDALLKVVAEIDAPGAPEEQSGNG